MFFPCSFDSLFSSLPYFNMLLRLSSSILFLFCYFPLLEAQGSFQRLSDVPNGICSSLVSPCHTYSCEEFAVETSDGFRLGVQRIGSKTGLVGEKKGPVLLLHGLMQGGDIWELNLPDEALAFILADAGYDVWVGNIRTTDFSYGHVSLPRNSKDYWDWSVDELAEYDVPTMLDLVHSITNTAVDLVAYSQGTQATFAAFSQGIAVNHVNKVVFLAPVAYLTKGPPLIESLLRLDLEQVFHALRIYELNSRLPGGKRQDVDLICALAGGSCFKDWVTLFTGYTCCINATRRSFIDKYETQGTSVKNLEHFQQQLKSGSFAKFDYGVWGNMQRYGSLKPPAYDLSKVPTQNMLLIHGSRDAYSNEDDVARLLTELQPGYIAQNVPTFGHIDFVLGTNANREVYDSVLDFLAS